MSGKLVVIMDLFNLPLDLFLGCRCSGLHRFRHPRMVPSGTGRPYLLPPCSPLRIHLPLDLPLQIRWLPILLAPLINTADICFFRIEYNIVYTKGHFTMCHSYRLKRGITAKGFNRVFEMTHVMYQNDVYVIYCPKFRVQDTRRVYVDTYTIYTNLKIGVGFTIIDFFIVCITGQSLQ
ncbi:hypothetical protein QTP88_005737 [Uroleucon formosanum]